MANNDLISRSELIAELMKGTIISDDLYGMGIMSGIDYATKLVKDAPAVDAVPVVPGRWIGRDIEHMWLRCSLCGKEAHSATVYCPNCGAKMDGDAQEPEEDEVCEACAITYSWERGGANVLGETNDADD